LTTNRLYKEAEPLKIVAAGASMPYMEVLVWQHEVKWVERKYIKRKDATKSSFQPNRLWQ